MLKKIVLILFVLLLTFAQIYLIYALQHGGVESFRDAWRTFGVRQTEYSLFVFNTIKWWWAVPTICLGLLALALRRLVALSVTVVVTASLTGTIALYWSVYSPSLMVRI
jgi:hypothetical protein